MLSSLTSLRFQPRMVDKFGSGFSPFGDPIKHRLEEVQKHVYVSSPFQSFLQINGLDFGIVPFIVVVKIKIANLTSLQELLWWWAQICDHHG